MKPYTLIKSLLLFVGLVLAIGLNAQTTTYPLTNGHYIKFSSKQLNENRRVFINVPSDYLEKAYPVAYVLGAEENDFRSSILKSEFIVVGIESTDFKKDFLNEESREQYITFLQDELLPFIEKEYNASPIRFLTGHSLAGGLVIDALLQSSEQFTFFAATSPPLQVINTECIDKAEFSEIKALYFNIGFRENYPELEEANHAFHFKLDSLKPSNLQWKFEVMKGENHETNAHTGFCRAYSFYKSLSSIPDSLLGQSINEIANYAANIKEKYGLTIVIDETVMMSNILINLDEKAFDNVKMCIEYMANNNAQLFADQIDVILEITDAIKKGGEKEMTLEIYQFIVEKTDDSIAKIMLHEMTREQ